MKLLQEIVLYSNERLYNIPIIIRDSMIQPRLFFTPDCHDGTRIDIVTSLLYLNQSVMISSYKSTLPRYYNLSIPKQFTVKSRVTKIVANFVTFVFEKNFLMVRTNMDNLIINYTHVVHYNGRV